MFAKGDFEIRIYFRDRDHPSHKIDFAVPGSRKRTCQTCSGLVLFVGASKIVVEACDNGLVASATRFAVSTSQSSVNLRMLAWT